VDGSLHCGVNGKTFQVIASRRKVFGGVLLGQTPNQIWIPLMMVRTGYRWCDACSENCHLVFDPRKAGRPARA
jgi:hypothetical protein